MLRGDFAMSMTCLAIFSAVYGNTNQLHQHRDVSSAEASVPHACTNPASEGSQVIKQSHLAGYLPGRSPPYCTLECLAETIYLQEVCDNVDCLGLGRRHRAQRLVRSVKYELKLGSMFF